MSQDTLRVVASDTGRYVLDPIALATVGVNRLIHIEGAKNRMQKPILNRPVSFTVVHDTAPNEWSVWSMDTLFRCKDDFDILFSNGAAVWRSNRITAEIRGRSVWFRPVIEEENTDEIDIGLMAFNDAGSTHANVHVDLRHPFSDSSYTSQNENFKYRAHCGQIVDADAM